MGWFFSALFSVLSAGSIPPWGVSSFTWPWETENGLREICGCSFWAFTDCCCSVLPFCAFSVSFFSGLGFFFSGFLQLSFFKIQDRIELKPWANSGVPDEHTFFSQLEWMKSSVRIFIGSASLVFTPWNLCADLHPTNRRGFGSPLLKHQKLMKCKVR